MKKIKWLCTLSVASLALMAFSEDFQDEWVVPEEYVNMKNPTDPSQDLNIGKVLYRKHCQSCHGQEGYGDGTKAAGLEGDLGDFSSEEFHSQTDGEIFYKSYIGRRDMPNYEKKIPDEEDMWLIVNYMRTMKE
jgi:mono/diheme cytochrome c family protein